MRRRWFYVFWYVNNDPNERGFYVCAKDISDVWAAIENEYGDEAEYYDVMEVKNYYGSNYTWVANGRFARRNEE